jgi:hypothetical protein
VIRPPFLPTTSATDQVIADLRAAAPPQVPFEALERCVRRFYEDRAMLAHAELQQIHQQLLHTQHDKSIDQTARHEANAALKWLKHQSLMQTIESLASRVEQVRFRFHMFSLTTCFPVNLCDTIFQLFGMLKNEDGWRVVHNSEGISTSYKQESGTNIVSMKVHAVFDCPVLDLLTLVSEIDLMPLFIKLLAVDVQVLKEASDFCKTIRVTVPLPWPLAGRDAVIDGQAIDMLSESGCVVVLMRQLEHGMHADLPVPEPAKGLVRIDVQQCGAVIRPLDEKLSYVEFVFRVDPKLAVVPDFLINFFTRKLTHMGTCLFRDQVCACLDFCVLKLQRC